MAIQVKATKDALAIKFGELATHGTVFTTAPGANPGTEPTGGSPAFARKPLTWSAPDANSKITASAVFDIPASTTLNGSGLFTALINGTYVEGKTETSVTFTGQDTITVNYSYTQV